MTDTNKKAMDLPKGEWWKALLPVGAVPQTQAIRSRVLGEITENGMSPEKQSYSIRHPYWTIFLASLGGGMAGSTLGTAALRKATGAESFAGKWLSGKVGSFVGGGLGAATAGLIARSYVLKRVRDNAAKLGTDPKIDEAKAKAKLRQIAERNMGWSALKNAILSGGELAETEQIRAVRSPGKKVYAGTLGAVVPVVGAVSAPLTGPIGSLLSRIVGAGMGAQNVVGARRVLKRPLFGKG